MPIDSLVPDRRAYIEGVMAALLRLPITVHPSPGLLLPCDLRDDLKDILSECLQDEPTLR